MVSLTARCDRTYKTIHSRHEDGPRFAQLFELVVVVIGIDPLCQDHCDGELCESCNAKVERM